jgi:hypothetical protein
MRFHVLAALGMKMTSFWDIKSFSLLKLTDVSEVRTASIIRAIRQHYTSLVLRDHTASFPVASHAHLDSNVVLVLQICTAAKVQLSFCECLSLFLILSCFT